MKRLLVVLGTMGLFLIPSASMAVEYRFFDVPFGTISVTPGDSCSESGMPSREEESATTVCTEAGGTGVAWWWQTECYNWSPNWPWWTYIYRSHMATCYAPIE